MKFVGEYKEHLFSQNGDLTVSFAVKGGEKAEAMETIAKLEKARLDAQKPVKYDIEIKKYYPIRSTHANNYCWKLLGLLAEKQSKTKGEITKEDLYKEYIRRFGKVSEVTLRNEAIESFIQAWTSKGSGLGWLVEKVTVKETDTTLWCYHGSSSFNSKEMYEFILGIVDDCKLEGIETRTPEEIAQMRGIREPKSEKQTQ
jgi:hypothetical protein